MSELKTLARPYAVAAYEFARERKMVDDWLVMLVNINVLVSTEGVQAILHSPMFDVDKFIVMLKPFAEKALDAYGFNFLMLLVVNRRLHLISVILELFQRIKAEAEGVLSVRITTAVTLDPSQQNMLVEKLAHQWKKNISPSFLVNDAILAGIVIAVGDDYVVDGSLKTRLMRLKTKF